MQTIASPWLWTTFLLLVAVLLALDLGVFHRRAHRVGFREAALWSVMWVLLAVAFNLGVYAWFGEDLAVEFATAYLLEKALAIDNIFVFAMIFSGLGIPSTYQHRILFWGVIGAVGLRAVMIAVGGVFLQHFFPVVYVFGVLLVLTGLRFLTTKRHRGGALRSIWVRSLRRVVPLTLTTDSGRFFVSHDGRFAATPLFLGLVAVEISDVIFAVDSIPAIFGITQDPFIVYTSNIFAVLGLRSMYFLLANLLDEFAHLKTGLSAVLVFVGLRMLLTGVVAVPAGASLGIIVLILGTAVLASVVHNPAGSDPDRDGVDEKHDLST